MPATQKGLAVARTTASAAMAAKAANVPAKSANAAVVAKSDP